MAKISELNKKERDLRNTLESLKRDYRKNKISKNDYDNTIKDKQKDLDKINDEKKTLIGKLPPIPAAPPSSSPLSAIKKEIGNEKPAEKPMDEKPVIKKSVIDKPAEKKEEPKEDEKEEPKDDILDKPAEKSVIDNLVEKSAEKPVSKVSAKKAAAKTEKTVTKKIKTITVKETTIKPKSVVKDSMPSVDDSQIKISRALKRMGDETDADTIKQVFEETQKEFLTFLLEVKKNREKIQQIESLFSEVNDIRKKFTAMDFKGMTDEIYKQFERMNDLIKENETKIEESISNNETKIGALEKKMDEMTTSLSIIPAIDEVKRDMEAVKQKIEWVEKNAKRVDVQPIMDMVSDVEKKLDSLKIKSPYIIE